MYEILEQSAWAGLRSSFTEGFQGQLIHRVLHVFFVLLQCRWLSKKVPLKPDISMILDLLWASQDRLCLLVCLCACG